MKTLQEAEEVERNGSNRKLAQAHGTSARVDFRSRNSPSPMLVTTTVPLLKNG
jgi:hypothetical protein